MVTYLVRMMPLNLLQKQKNANHFLVHNNLNVYPLPILFRIQDLQIDKCLELPQTKRKP